MLLFKSNQHLVKENRIIENSPEKSLEISKSPGISQEKVKQSKFIEEEKRKPYHYLGSTEKAKSHNKNAGV